MSKFTGERLESYIYNRSTIEHLHRYAIALEYIQDKIVLDIASGEGYGTNILASKAAFVYGVDVDAETIKFAAGKYRQNNLEYLEGNTSKIPLDDNYVDVVVSFETIEHHDEHEEMMREIKRVLKSNGMLIISTPDKIFYSDERGYSNPFHVKEFYKKDFISLGKDYFEEVKVLNQLSINSNSYLLKENDLDYFKSYSGSFDSIQSLQVKPMFTTLVCSDDPNFEIVNSTFNGNLVSQRISIENVEKIRRSFSFRLGFGILSPFRKIRSFLRSL